MGTAVRMVFAASLLLLPAGAEGATFPDRVPGDNGAISDTSPAAAERPEGPVPRVPRWKNAAVIGGIGLTVGVYGAIAWWDDGFSGSFRTESEGWFGKNT
ncbi:MAG TPA: hypothetical protein VFT11_03770, partial [Candidatus Deferrimicrobiaceae bacterium]|nr:hypothetical protein [Candidatus Deferrimicrobiaceae bacterium]